MPRIRSEYTVQHRVFMYENYVRTDSFGKTRKRFKKEFPQIPAPRKNVIQEIVTRFRKTGSLLDDDNKTKGKRKHKDKKISEQNKKQKKDEVVGSDSTDSQDSEKQTVLSSQSEDEGKVNPESLANVTVKTEPLDYFDTESYNSTRNKIKTEVDVKQEVDVPTASEVDNRSDELKCKIKVEPEDCDSSELTDMFNAEAIQVKCEVDPVLTED